VARCLAAAAAFPPADEHCGLRESRTISGGVSARRAFHRLTLSPLAARAVAGRRASAEASSDRGRRNSMRFQLSGAGDAQGAYGRGAAARRDCPKRWFRDKSSARTRGQRSALPSVKQRIDANVANLVRWRTGPRLPRVGISDSACVNPVLGACYSLSGRSTFRRSAAPGFRSRIIS
jgi:hypothetical protein